MTPNEFVSRLKTECRDAAVEDCIALYKSPPGRKPDQSLVEISKWFNALSEQDRGMLLKVMSDVADSTLFGVLAVLDGARTIEEQGEKSVFHLSAHKAVVESVLCPGPHDLHDL
ncbi:MAG: hypothetical protein LBF93_07155 [Zoogloeaceae bacterium]|jgi:hypothetical protein|nr:hypothetical protein [Zoogloeaceae bacterium]